MDIAQFAESRWDLIKLITLRRGQEEEQQRLKTGKPLVRDAIKKRV